MSEERPKVGDEYELLGVDKAVEMCTATMTWDWGGEREGEVFRCTRFARHEQDPDQMWAFHEHMSPGRPVVRWKL